MKSVEVRARFLDYFAARGHERVKSSPLVPHDDPTLLFTNAGMNQFKDVFTGRESRGYKRATSSQKCVRAGGKHNDLENVGRTARHHTFFEMLGNFSFGDYFKQEAIEFCWELLVKDYGIDPRRFVITIFGGDAAMGIGPDDEARAIWRKISGFSDDRIIGMGVKDNFWMMGDTGPQGPCSEVHYFVGPSAGSGVPPYHTFGEEPAPDGRGWMEIWNLVFMQYQKDRKDGPLEKLPRPSIDTGAGLERVTAVIQGRSTNYDGDLLRPLVEHAAEMSKKRYGASMADDDVSMRVLADHARAATFLIADGVMPSNEGRGYVLRRIMRRAIRHGVRIGLQPGQYRELCEQVVALMGGFFPEVVDAKDLIARAVDAEDESFRRTLDRGLKLLDDEVQRMHNSLEKTIPGETVFKLYDTYGFPADLTRTIAEEKALTVDEAGFEAEMEKQRARSEEFAGSGEKATANVHMQLREQFGATTFSGYATTEDQGTIRALLDEKGARIERAAAGATVELVTDRTPFYGESGGQVGDAGRASGERFAILIQDTLKIAGDFIVHRGVVQSGEVAIGDEVRLHVDERRRNAIRANHSATHLLHWALKYVLGAHVAQKGSLVAPDRLRFDFSHFAPVSDEEKRRVEDLVNEEIRKNAEAKTEVKGYEDARKMGAVALFGEKYGDEVRVMKIGEHSMELCGGTHVRRAGDIGMFKIVTEAGIAQGVRRLEAVTGEGAALHVRRLEGELAHAGALLRAPSFEVAARVEKLQKELRDRERKIEELSRKLAGGGGRDLIAEAREVQGVRVVAARTDVGDPKALREVADQLRERLRSGVVVLGGVADGKVALVAAVTSDLTARFHAGKIIASLSAQVGGKGGGKPDLAQGGGTRPEALDAALADVERLLAT